MAFNDLRSFIDCLESENELVRVKEEVDWNLEVGGITRRAIDLRERAPLFERIKDYPPEYKLAGCLIGPTKPIIQGRLAMAMGLSKLTPPLELIKTFDERTERPIKPIIASDAPCKEEVHKGEEVNVLEFPAPLIHGVDGGRYIGTWHVCVTIDPDNGWVNWGTYRLMVHDKKTLGILLQRTQVQHGGRTFAEKYASREKPMPIAVAIGTDPISTIVAATPFPAKTNESEMAGALCGRPVPLVHCETVDLEVPASSEIVIEGEIPPDELRPEGPFGEYTGYSVSSDPMPIIKVKCITHRRGPILPMSNMGKPWDEAAVIDSISRSVVARKILRRNEIPFKEVYTNPTAQSFVISTASLPGIGVKISSALWGSGTRADLPFIFIVGDDIDVTNPEDVIWCLTTRLHPKNGIHIIEGRTINPLLPWLTPVEREVKTTCGLYFEAIFPASWTREYKTKHCSIIDFHSWPKEIQQKVESKWAKYGYNDKV